MMVVEQVFRINYNFKCWTTLFIADVPTGDVINFTFPEDGILFPKGIFCKTKTNVAAYTLLTDKYSGPNLTTNKVIMGGSSFSSDQSVAHATGTSSNGCYR